MLNIVERNSLKGKDLSVYSYIVESLSDFYELVEVISVPIKGKYNILLYSNDAPGLLNLYKVSDSYKHMNITVAIKDKNVISKLKLSLPNAEIGTQHSLYEQMLELVKQKNLVIETTALSKLYGSVNTSFEEIEDALNKLEEAYGKYNLISVSDLAKIIVIREVTYPRQVMMAYLRQERYRTNTLTKSIKDFGDKMVFYAIRKNIDKIREEKLEFIRSGKGSKSIANIPLNNIMLMYYIFVINGLGLPKDPTIALYAYEKGVKEFDNL